MLYHARLNLLRWHISGLLSMGSALLLAQGTAVVDSLLATWPVQQRMQDVRSKVQPAEWETVDTDALYVDIKHCCPALPVFHDERVDHFVNLFAGPRRDAFRALLGMAHVQEAMLEKELARRGLPNELKYLPMALSAMNPQATSATGGAGLWMLPWPVAMRYGLLVTPEVDERHDPAKSTEAALHYLEDLQGRDGDRHTTVLAFCVGPANVERALKRTGGDADPRLLYRQFGEAQQDILPMLMAFVYLSENDRALGIQALSFRHREAVDVVQADSAMRFHAMAHVMEIPEARLRALNPSLIGEGVPAGRPFNLPRGDADRFQELAYVIYEAQRSRPRVPVPLAQEPETVEKLADGREAILYRIDEGDCIGCIADRFQVRVSEIKEWNELSSDQIDVGNTLMLYVSPEQRAKYEADTEPAESARTRNVATTDMDHSWYTVRSGDSLYMIAKKYPGVSADDLMRLNRISADIRPGQRIKIPRR